MTTLGPDDKPGRRARARNASAAVSGEMARIRISVQRWRAAHAAYREGHPRPLWLKILGWAALGGVAGVVVLVFILPDDAFKGVVQHWATQKAGRDVHIGGDLHVNLLSWTPKVVARDVMIANPIG